MTIDPDTPQVTTWKGEFGNAYLYRNQWNPAMQAMGEKAFRRVLRSPMASWFSLRSILEVGAGCGVNLHYLRAILCGKQVAFHAVEPNPAMYGRLTSDLWDVLTTAYLQDGFCLPYASNSIDLVFTQWVLIHIHAQDLPRLTDEIVRVANRWVVAMEYFAIEEETKPYRGQDNFFFKRDYGKWYQSHYPQLRCVEYGFLWSGDAAQYHDTHWWLFEKTS